jgi:hypothetical protein
VLKKKGLGACDTGPVKVASEGALNSRPAAKSQVKKQNSGGGLTPMQFAFLGALSALARRSDSSITPTGDVAPHELRQAVVALVRAKGEGSK